MTTTLIPFQFYDDKIYACIVDNKEYFVAKYVCEVLEYSNPRDAINRHCKKGGY